MPTWGATLYRLSWSGITIANWRVVDAFITATDTWRGTQVESGECWRVGRNPTSQQQTLTLAGRHYLSTATATAAVAQRLLIFPLMTRFIRGGWGEPRRSRHVCFHRTHGREMGYSFLMVQSCLLYCGRSRAARRDYEGKNRPEMIRPETNLSFPSVVPAGCRGICMAAPSVLLTRHRAQPSVE
jgi:hypothetical protein